MKTSSLPRDRLPGTTFIKEYPSVQLVNEILADQWSSGVRWYLRFRSR